MKTAVIYLVFVGITLGTGNRHQRSPAT